MTTLLHVLEAAGILAVGLLLRLGLVLLLLAALAAPILLALEVWYRLAPLRARLFGPRSVGGMPWREDLYYAPGHTWLKPRWGSRVQVGIDGLVQRLVPDVRAVELPPVGSRLSRGQMAARIRCTERDAEIMSPLEGTVTGVNDSLETDPALILRDPYGRGWLFSMKPAVEEPERLSHGEAARVWFRGEGIRLARLLETDLGLAAADGGDLLGPAPQLLSAERWSALTGAFLQAGGAMPSSAEAEQHGPSA